MFLVVLVVVIDILGFCLGNVRCGWDLDRIGKILEKESWSFKVILDRRCDMR